MQRIQFAELTTVEADAVARDTRAPVLLLPVGAVEAHGPHAPLSTDVIISSGVCTRAAAALADDPRLRALVLPAIPYGVTRFAAGFRGTIHVEEDTLHALIVDLCRSLARDGFPRVAIVNSHFEPAHIATLRRAVQTLHDDEGDGRVGLLEPTRRRNAQRLTDEFRRGSCHAGQYETSLILRDRPELIDQAGLPALAPLEVDMPAAMARGDDSFVALGMADAYCGAPAQATAAEGEESFTILVELLMELIEELVRED